MATTVRYRIMEMTNNTTMAICKHSVLCMSRDQSLHQRKTPPLPQGTRNCEGAPGLSWWRGRGHASIPTFIHTLFPQTDPIPPHPTSPALVILPTL